MGGGRYSDGPAPLQAQLQPGPTTPLAIPAIWDNYMVETYTIPTHERPTMAGTKRGAETGPKKISKNEAVRRAVAALGEGAELAALQAHIRKEFGFEMTTNHISASRTSMRHKKGKKGGRKKGAKKPAPASAAKAV